MRATYSFSYRSNANTMPNLLVLSAIFYSALTICSGIERELTINVDPRREDCFYQTVKTGQIIDLEYQVIDGGHGDLDITFRVADPGGRIWVTDYKKSENTHRITAKTDGDHRFCFDNTFSAFNSKTIFFELIIDGEEAEDIDWEGLDKKIHFGKEIDGLVPEEVYGMKLQTVLDTVANIKVHLNKVRHLQDTIKSSEARDRNLAEENFFIVNTFSGIQIMVMVVVGFIQVVMVRSLFDDSSRVKTIWSKLNQR